MILQRRYFVFFLLITFLIISAVSQQQHPSQKRGFFKWLKKSFQKLTRPRQSLNDAWNFNQWASPSSTGGQNNPRPDVNDTPDDIETGNSDSNNWNDDSGQGDTNSDSNNWNDDSGNDNSNSDSNNGNDDDPGRDNSNNGNDDSGTGNEEPGEANSDNNSIPECTCVESDLCEEEYRVTATGSDLYDWRQVFMTFSHT